MLNSAHVEIYRDIAHFGFYEEWLRRDAMKIRVTVIRVTERACGELRIVNVKYVKCSSRSFYYSYFVVNMSLHPN